MLQKIIDNDKQWERAKEEVTRVVALHSVSLTKLEEQEQLSLVEEQRARVSDGICSCALLFMEKKWIFNCCYSSTGRDGQAQERSEQSGDHSGTTKGNEAY